MGRTRPPSLFTRLRRRALYSFTSAFAQTLDPHQVVRNNLIQNPEFAAALQAFDSQDYRKAFEHFEDLAEQGNPAAQTNLGILCETGTGILIRDDKAAEDWYRKAANQGFAVAQYQLAAILAADLMAEQTTYGPEEDESRFIETYMWLLLAEAQDHPDTATSIKRLSKHMTPAQIDESQNLAREWREKHRH